MDRKTFSWLMQCHTGHAHTGEYYRRFVPSQEIDCPCGAEIQTRQHITLQCRIHHQHRHTLGHGRHAEWGWLTGTYKGIKKLIAFIKHSNAFDKPALVQGPDPNEQRMRWDGMRQEASARFWHRQWGQDLLFYFILLYYTTLTMNIWQHPQSTRSPEITPQTAQLSCRMNSMYSLHSTELAALLHYHMAMG